MVLIKLNVLRGTMELIFWFKLNLYPYILHGTKKSDYRFDEKSTIFNYIFKMIEACMGR